MTTPVYIGPWINWAHGPVVGATVTLSQRSGNLLISFVATFVTLVGAQLWRILSFIIHQVRASQHPQDGLHYQQQIVFRNTSGPGGLAWTFLQQLWYWPGKARAVVLRTVPWIIFSVLYIALFAIIATFSAEVSKASGKLRLVDGNDCGYWTVDPTLDSTDPDVYRAFNQKMANDSLVSATYARACYGGTPNKLQCQNFPVQNIPWTAKQNAPCPFDSGVCGTASFQMTTGRIDSYADLGINLPPSERVQLIKDTTCAPLTQSRDHINGSSAPGGYGVDGDTIIRYQYGTIGQPDTGDFQNWTWLYNTHTSLDQIPFSTWSLMSEAPHTKLTGWNPSKKLIRTDADVSIIFIAGNSMTFLETCEDPVFGANYEVRGTVQVYYQPDEWAVPIACAERYKICNPQNDQCTEWSGIEGLLNATDLIGVSDAQANVTGRMVMAAQYSPAHFQTMTRGASALRALESASGLVLQTLPSNQWEIEVSSWFDTGLSRLQHLIQDFAVGTTNVAKGSVLQRPSEMQDKTSEKMCHNQLIRDSAGSASFSILGLVIIFVVGGFVIVTSLALDTIVGWVQERLKKGMHKKLSWQLDDKLQQQRMLLEAVGLGSWEGARGFPTTIKPAEFGGYDSFDTEHPAMKMSSAQSANPLWVQPQTNMVPNKDGSKSTDVFVREVSS